MRVRPATLQDTSAISRLFCARIGRWQRLDAQGRGEDVSYEQLTLYERWSHGGPWLSVETAAIWLNQLLSGAGLPLVLEHENRLIGYAELYTNDETELRAHGHIAEWLIEDDAPVDALMTFIEGMVPRAPQGRLSAACSPYDTASVELYGRCGFSLTTVLHPLRLAAQSGQGFYKATDLEDVSASRIQGWGMPIGRITSPRHLWETLMPRLWRALPEVTALPRHRLHINASGQEAFACLQQHPYDARTVDVYCWTSKPLSQQVINALRDRASRQGYRTLCLTVTEKMAALIGGDEDAAAGQRHIFVREL
jgi:hypothetical protein